MEATGGDAATALGEALRRHRLARGLSVRAVAARLQMQGHGGLTDYEKGRRIPPADLTTRYERVFGLARGELHRLRDTALAARAARAARVARDATAAPGDVPVATPRESPLIAELPAAPPDFCGRTPELAAIAALPVAEGAVAVLTGPPGVGKSTLALRAAHTASFADTWFHVDLRGGTDTPADPADVLHRLLRTLGVPDDRIPPGIDDRAARYRSLLRGRRTVLVLDDAATESQIRPLLPGGGPSLVLVTGRRRLGGPPGARLLTVDVPPLTESLALFTAIVGARARAEPAAAHAVVGACGHLPLAVRIVGMRLVAWPEWTVGYLATLLDDERRRLSRLAIGDAAVRPAFALAYRGLRDGPRRLFRRLSLVPGPDTGPAAAAALLGTDEPAAADLLDDLAAAGVLSPAAGAGRYHMHDLLRLYARERLLAEESDPAGVERGLLDRLLADAYTAARAIAPCPDRRASAGERAAALAWLDAEEPTVRGAVRAAVRGATALDDAHLLVDELSWYYDLRCRWPELAELGRTVLRLADRTGHPLHRAAGNNAVGAARVELGRAEDAVRHHLVALDAARRAGDRYHEAVARQKLGVAYWSLDRGADAVEAHRAEAALAAEHGTPWQAAAARSRLGQSLRLAGRRDAAYTELTAAHARLAALGDRRGAAMAGMRLAGLANDLGDHAAALRRAESARGTFAKYDDAWGVAMTRLESGRAALGLGRGERAARDLRAAVEGLAAAGSSAEASTAARLLAALSRKRPQSVP